MNDDCLECGQPAGHWTHFPQDGARPACDYQAPKARTRMTAADHHAKAAELRRQLTKENQG